MWCELEQIQLKTPTCPVKCMYRAANGSCAYDTLSDEQVDIQKIAELWSQKVYRLKSLGAGAKQMIEIGLAIDRYADYIKEVVPADYSADALAYIRKIVDPYAQSDDPSDMDLLDIELDEEEQVDKPRQVVNTNESSTGVPARLKRLFKLTNNQQQEFWSAERFSNWSKRSGTSVSLQEMRQALLSI